MNKTICYNCQNFFNLEPQSPRKDVWYNHLCKAHPLPIEINPVTGKAQAKTQNDLGMPIYGDNNFDYCRNHNTGSCTDFIEKEVG